MRYGKVLSTNLYKSLQFKDITYPLLELGFIHIVVCRTFSARIYDIHTQRFALGFAIVAFQAVARR